MCLLTMAGTGAFAYDFEANGLYYNITNTSTKTVEVTLKASGVETYFLTKVVIPSSVTSCGYYAFANCEKLNSVEIYSCEVAYGAFNECPALTDVTIHEGVVSIGQCYKHLLKCFQ